MIIFLHSSFDILSDYIEEPVVGIQMNQAQKKQEVRKWNELLASIQPSLDEMDFQRFEKCRCLRHQDLSLPDPWRRRH